MTFDFWYETENMNDSKYYLITNDMKTQATFTLSGFLFGYSPIDSVSAFSRSMR